MSESTENKSRRINWTPEKVMSTSAVVISLISLIALFYELKLSREENALIRMQQSASVLPHLSLAFNTRSDRYEMTFINQGVGPAFIKEVEFSIDGNLRYKRADHMFNAVDSIIQVTEGQHTPMTTYSFQEGEVIPANKEVNILTVRGDERTALFLKHFNSLDWDFSVIYEDVYGARWRLSWESPFPVAIPKE